MYVCMYNSIATGKQLSLLKGHNGTVREVAFNTSQTLHRNTNDNNILLASAGAGDFRTRIWDINTGTIKFIERRLYIWL